MARKILIVDDDSDFVEAVTMILKPKKFEVVAAYEGEERIGS